MKSLILLLSLSLLTLSTSLAQGKWTLGLEVANRSELRKYEDSYQYLFKGTRGSAAFPVGMNVAFQYSERWRFESGLISTPYSRTVAVYYNEPGYTRIANRPISYTGHTATLEIPLRIVYNTNLRWKSIQFNVMGGAEYLSFGRVYRFKGQRWIAGNPSLALSSNKFIGGI